MGIKGVANKIAWVNLNNKEVEYEKPNPKIYEQYLGGYGLGAYYLFKKMKPNVDAFGPENILGLITGCLTGTKAITGNRFIAVGKSPKTGGWGDANCGGRFGPALKMSGLDAIFIKGIADKPVYLLVENGKVTIKKADNYWGLTCSETEDKFKNEYGEKAVSAVIGPTGENKSLIASIITDKGRAAARSGLGAVMGSKLIKGVVAIPTRTVEVAKKNELNNLRKKILKEHYNNDNPFYVHFSTAGTPGALEASVLSGDAPIKNWKGWVDHFENFENIGGEANMDLQVKPYACWQCPLACGGHVKVPSGPYKGEGHKPEYETLGMLGSACLNDNLESICKLNTICNDNGMDTISTGATIAFAIECFESDIITKEDTNGIELTWGNHEAIVKIAKQMAKGEGFGGKVLSDGIKTAIEKIGPEAKKYAMECGGEELPAHDPRFVPGIATSYVADATPGRHTQYGSWLAEAEFLPSDLDFPEFEDKYSYQNKGETHKFISCFGHVINASGLCMFGATVTPAKYVPQYLTLAMGRNFTMDDILNIGERIANIRIAFNLREGIKNKDMYDIPKRTIGEPPLKGGPTKDITVDLETQLNDYYNAMGWDPETGIPKNEVFERLDLEFAIDVTIK